MTFTRQCIRLLVLTFVFITVASLTLPNSLAATGKDRMKKGPSKKRMVLYAPTGYERVVILLNKGREYKYYLFSRQKSLKLEVEGTTELAIKIRLLYDITMKGPQPFTVLIEEDSLLGLRSKVASYSFTAEKSRISTFQGEAKVVPSKAYGFKVVVPDGRHRYTISFNSTSAQSAAIRILIPKKDLQIKKGKKE